MVAEFKEIMPLLKARKVRVASQMFDLESERLCIEIQGVFARAGMALNISDCGSMMVQGEIWGIKIVGAADDIRLVKRLGNSFSSHVGPSVAMYANGASGNLTIVVGVKPIPDIPWPEENVPHKKNIQHE